MDRQALEVVPREPGNKGTARRLRRGGHVPAVLYGSGVTPVTLAVEAQHLDRVLHAGTNAILDLRGTDSVKGKLALVKDLQRDPVSRRVLHCDLFAVDVKKKVTVAIPLHFGGKSHGVEMGGVLEPLMRELEVECLPLEIPDAFEVDVSELDIGDSIHVRDISVPDTVAVLADRDTTVIHVVAPRVEEEPVTEEEEVAAEVGEGVAEDEAPPAAEAADTKGEEGSG